MALRNLLILATSVIAAFGLFAPRHCAAQIDNLISVVDARSFIGNKKLGAFGFDPSSDSIFLTAYNADPFIAGNPAIVKVANVSSVQSADVMVSTSQLNDYYTDNNGNLVIYPSMLGGFLLNPKQIAGAPAYSMALITDGVSIRTANGAVLPSMSKRVYAYNLKPAPIGSDGRDVFTTRVTLADMQAAANKTTTSSFVQRQFAWSGDGQSIYFADSSPGYGGLWQISAVTGTARQILVADDVAAEPAVRTSSGVDQIFISGGGSTGNAGGIDFLLYDGSSASSRQVAVATSKLLEFFEVSANMPSQRVQSLATLGSDLFFAFYTNASGTKSESLYPGIYRYDAEGRLSKIVNRTQRGSALGAVSLVFDRVQTRTISLTGSTGTFSVPQVLYNEGGINTVAGATAFKPVDFNRDNQVTAADLALFAPQVTIRGQLKATGTSGVIADLKFDMNGNDTVDWKDVQIVEGFLDYVADPALAGRIVPALPIQADADLNGLVDFNDFLTMRGTYGSTSQPFTRGDYNGDNQVSFPDLQPWINSYGFRSAVVGGGVPMAPFDQAAWNQFLAGLSPPAVTLDVATGTQTQFQAGYRTIVIAASVTKTGSGTLVYDTANTYTGTTHVAAGTLELADPSAAATTRVNVGGGGRLAVAPAIATTVAGLSLAPGALANLTNGAITVASGLTPPHLVAQLLAGRADGTWTGTSGITSTTVAADVAAGVPRAVGWMDNGDGSLTAAYAAPGDTNLDWAVDVLDVANLVAGGKYNSGEPATWFEGDFNYDGVVDIQDVSDFGSTGLYSAGTYNPPSAASGGVAAVPEPAACWPIVLGAIAIACRRRPAKS